MRPNIIVNNINSTRSRSRHACGRRSELKFQRFRSILTISNSVILIKSAGLQFVEAMATDEHSGPPHISQQMRPKVREQCEIVAVIMFHYDVSDGH